MHFWKCARRRAEARAASALSESGSAHGAGGGTWGRKGMTTAGPWPLQSQVMPSSVLGGGHLKATMSPFLHSGSPRRLSANGECDSETCQSSGLLEREERCWEGLTRVHSSVALPGHWAGRRGTQRATLQSSSSISLSGWATMCACACVCACTDVGAECP